MNFNSLTKTDIYGYAFLIFAFSFGIYLSNTNMNLFENRYAKEDGTVEYATSFMLFSIGILQFYRLIYLRKYKNLFWRVGVLGFVILFFFGAGEEISWGQRILGIESSEYFVQNNAQQEMNLHNLIVGGTKINKLIFSQLLTFVLVIYLLILPILYRKYGTIKNLMAAFAVPLVRWHHSIAFIIASFALIFIPSSKKWELYELAFAIIFFLIFLNPHNVRIYSKTV